MTADEVLAEMSAGKSGYLRKIRKPVLECRGTGHRWSIDYVSNHHGYRVRSLTCDRCGTVRDEVHDGYGHVAKRKYHYPLDYKKPSNVERIMRNEVTTIIYERTTSARAKPNATIMELVEKLG